MSRTRGILGRLRPLAAPGPPAPAGVPSDHLAELSAELAPVFAALAATEAAAESVRRRAVDEARVRRDRAAADAERILAGADTQAAEARLAALEQARRAAHHETARLLAQAESEAERQREIATRRIPEIVALVVSEVRGLADGRRLASGGRASVRQESVGPAVVATAGVSSAASRTVGDSR